LQRCHAERSRDERSGSAKMYCHAERSRNERSEVAAESKHPYPRTKS
jgi:hypothetical protein